MYKWYSNKQVSIYFDDFPQVAIRYSLPSFSKEERKSIEKYPFICKKNLKVYLQDLKKNKTYQFMIPKGYCYDGASIPRLFWRLIGANTDNKFLIAALVHDVLCENHSYVDFDKSFSTEVFNALLEAGGVGHLRRHFMKNSVALYQTLFCNWSQGRF